MTGFQRLAVTAAAATYLLMFLGAGVRTTGSGLGCPDWPLCHGQIVPPLELTAITEYLHRFMGAIVSLLIAAIAVGAWVFRRRDPAIVVPASAVVLLLVAQILLGAVTVLMELPPVIVAFHLGLAMLILGVLVWLAVADGGSRSSVRGELVEPQTNQLRIEVHPSTGSGRTDSQRATDSGFPRWTVGVALMVYGLIITGALVRATGASWACQGFPGCNGDLLPFGASLQIDLHLTHRLAAYTVALLIGLTIARARPLAGAFPAIWRAAVAAGIAVAFQVTVGAVAVIWGPGPLVQALHVAGASAVWAALVVLASLAFRSRRLLSGRLAESSFDMLRTSGEGVVEAPPRSMSYSQVLAAYLALTKPRIIWLLLVTTLGAMLVAAEGLPALGLVFWTMLGGALGAGAANAINCYIDRDIDEIMARTNLRPIPAGLITPSHALRFGLLLGLLSFFILTVFVNVLSAVLTMAALAFYVFIYTSWLKRTSPNNIVIGGAAGAVPPMVGWAAVTGELSWMPIGLFIIIFFWTPPHFWALSLLMKREYERAGIPMLPVVKGEEETRRQIMLYSLFLVALTLVFVIFKAMGAFYLLSAALLGGIFLYYAERLRREADAPAARRLFKYSIYYLVLLFASMVVDRQMFL